MNSSAKPVLFAAPSAAGAATASAQPPVTVPSFRIEAEAEADHYLQGLFLPDTQATRVNAGKKTRILDFDSLPRINGNNYRRATTTACAPTASIPPGTATTNGGAALEF